MFDIGLWEMVVIGVVALVVLGPERLPKVARTAGHLIGRLQRYVAQVKSDINREIELSELSKVKSEFEQAAASIKSTVEGKASEAEKEFRDVEAQIDRELNPAASAPELAPRESRAADEIASTADDHSGVAAYLPEPEPYRPPPPPPPPVAGGRSAL